VVYRSGWFAQFSRNQAVCRSLQGEGLGGVWHSEYCWDCVPDQFFLPIGTMPLKLALLKMNL
jgi:hypothetical protein